MLKAIDFVLEEGDLPYIDIGNFGEELDQHTRTLYALGALDDGVMLKLTQSITRANLPKCCKYYYKNREDYEKDRIPTHLCL